MYTILEARIELKDNRPERVIVLVEISAGDIRAICATTTPRPGYMHISQNDVVDQELLQRVAGFGMQLDLTEGTIYLK